MDPTVNKKTLTDLAKDYPIVQCSEYDEDGTICYVSIDNELAAYHAVRHLIKLGHEKIALINSDEKFLYARERYRGFQKAMEEFELPIRPEWILNMENVKFEDGQQAMKGLLKQEVRPTAVFAVSDVLAIGALKELNINQIRVPEDIALVGFDKIVFSNMTHPTLTTISQPMYKMGSISANMLINKIKGKAVESVILEHELVIREST